MSAPISAPQPADAPECDHDWEFVDDSFSHEFGTEVCGHWECQICGATTNKCPHYEGPFPEDFPDHE